MQQSFEERVEPGTESWVRYGADHVVRYCFAVQHARGVDVLDAGTGPGYGAAILARSGAKSVQAVDLNEDTIKRAQVRYGGTGVRYLADDCQRLERVRGPVGLICSFENIEHLPEPEAFLGAAGRLLGEGGVLLCSTPDKATAPAWVNGRPANPFHINEWTREEFRAMLGRHFRSVDMHCEVLLYTHEARAEGVRALDRHLKILWENPAVRVSRAIARLFGRRVHWEDLGGLAYPSMSDYAIVPAEAAEVFGRSHCHYAICREPIGDGR